MLTCVHCQRRYDSKPTLEAHLATVHKGSANAPCRTCISCPPPNNTFVNLERHFVDAHGLKLAPTSHCPHCDRQFKSAVSRNRHAVICADRPKFK